VRSLDLLDSDAFEVLLEAGRLPDSEPEALAAKQMK